MRLWHKDLLPYLPDLQFKGQLRELVLIMHDWRDKGQTNHLLINRVMGYPKSHLLKYLSMYAVEYKRRYDKHIKQDIVAEFLTFCGYYKAETENIFSGWHEKDYLRVCMANLYEKHIFGKGNSRISDGDWALLCKGYKDITGLDYSI